MITARLLQSTPLKAKLVLLLAPALVGLLVLGASLVQQLRGDAATAQQEVGGLVPLRQLQKVVRLTQQHRGLSGAWLAGDASAGSKRSGRETEVNEAMTAYAALVASGAVDGAMPADWQITTARWQSLATDVRDRVIKAPDAIVRHTALIQSELTLMDQLLFDSQLILDPTPDGYSLVALIGQQLPIQAERLGQLRGRGTAALASKTITPQDAATLVALIAQAEAASISAGLSMKHALAANPDLGEALRGPADAARQQMATLIALTRSELVDAENLAMSSADFYGAATKAIDAQFALLDVAATELEKLLQARAQSLHKRTAAVAAGVVLALLVSVWIAAAIAGELLRGFRHALKVAEALAEGRLGIPVTAPGRDEMAQLLRALARTQQSLLGIVTGVRQGVDSVSAAAVQIGQGTQQLEQRTQQQAASVASTASSMQQMTSSVQMNAQNAVSAAELAVQANAVATQGGQVVQQVVGTMAQIQASSSRIGDIIGTIDGIAFQTNILALNAAVEAARAGEQGRGFAVVASEVRSLAQRSAGAAREIKQLIAESVERVSVGHAAVQQAGHTIDDMVGQVQRVADLIRQISQATHEQSGGITEVGRALTQLDESTQQNASMVEESGAAARSLQDQAQQLLDRVSVFRLTET